MEMQEALQWTDDLVFARTGKHLDSLQRAILEGVWEHQEYQDIAEKYHCSTDHIRKSASELWKILSDLLGDDVKKKNVRARIENGIFFYYNDGVQIGDQINLCRELYGHPKTGKKGSPDSATHNKSAPCHDLSQAPENICFYSRTDELATLKQWILKEHSRIITITGLSGIGKTALARQLVEDIKDNFDRILWRTHQRFLTLNALQSHLAEFFAPPSPTKNSSVINSLNAHNSLLDYLRSQRWLIILDDFQETLNPGEFIGNYCPEYQKYGQWIQEMGDCLIKVVCCSSVGNSPWKLLG